MVNSHAREEETEGRGSPADGDEEGWADPAGDAGGARRTDLRQGKRLSRQEQWRISLGRAAPRRDGCTTCRSRTMWPAVEGPARRRIRGGEVRGEGEAPPRNPLVMEQAHRAEALAATTTTWGRAQTTQGYCGCHHGSVGRGCHRWLPWRMARYSLRSAAA